MLGNVYRMPKDVGDGETFLAGQKQDWHVEEVEVWQASMAETP